MDITFSNVTESDLKIIVGLFSPHCGAPAQEIPIAPAEKAPVKTLSQAMIKKEQIAAPAPGNGSQKQREKRMPLPQFREKKDFNRILVSRTKPKTPTVHKIRSIEKRTIFVDSTTAHILDSSKTGS